MSGTKIRASKADELMRQNSEFVGRRSREDLTKVKFKDLSKKSKNLK